MKKKRNIALLALLLLLLLLWSAENVRADEISELKQQLNEQAKMLREMQERLSQLEARQRLKERSMTEKIEEVAEKQKETPALPDTLKWAEKIKLSGDLRYRHETIDAEGDDKGTRNRDRIRARLRLDAEVNDEFDAIFRLATAENDDGFASGSTTTNVTFDREFRQKNIWLDWAYGNYHPEHMPGFNVLFGKMPGPVHKVGKNQLIYDDDLAWEGGALNYKIPLNDEQEMFINGGGFWLNEVDGVDTTADASLWAIQTGLNQKIDNMSLTYGASYYHFGNAEKASLTLGSSSAFDNTYNIVEGFGEVGTKIGELPFSVYASYVNNTGTDSSGDTAWIVGAMLNKAKDPGSWELGYSYRDIEADAVAGRLNYSDFIGGGSGGEGHEFKAAYQVHKNVKAGLTYILAERDRSTGNDLDYDRLMADIILKF
ncbi:MAG: hypothetical protein GY774_21935 [Planctomycetes bacterium]|nr:hypothetical protein [Planctomycetota bacterium]